MNIKTDNTQYNLVAQEILGAYERFLFAFSINKKRHFAERMYHITKDPKYIVQIKHSVQIKLCTFNKYISAVKNKKEAQDLGLKIINRAYPEDKDNDNTSRFILRYDYQKNIP